MNDIPCVLMRGGSSKGLFFLAQDLPADAAMRDRLLLAAMGSPDLRQIDGMGGGNDLSSKVVIVAPSRSPMADVEYLFAQVSVARGMVEALSNSGNMLAAVGPFALEHGLVRASHPSTTVRILNINSNKLVEATIQTPQGRVNYSGDFQLDGVPGSSAPIRLRFLEPAGAKTGKLLPTGRARDVIDGVQVSCIDFAIPIVFVPAAALGRTGRETPQELDHDKALLERLEAIRLAAANLMGLDDVPDQGIPKIALISRARHGGTITSRYFVPASCHPAHAASGALALAAACHTTDTVAEELAELEVGDPGSVVIEHPSGTMHCRLEFAIDPMYPTARISSASLVTSARPLLSGSVSVANAPDSNASNQGSAARPPSAQRRPS